MHFRVPETGPDPEGFLDRWLRHGDSVDSILEPGGVDRLVGPVRERVELWLDRSAGLGLGGVEDGCGGPEVSMTTVQQVHTVVGAEGRPIRHFFNPRPVLGFTALTFTRDGSALGGAVITDAPDCDGGIEPGVWGLEPGLDNLQRTREYSSGSASDTEMFTC